MDGLVQGSEPGGSPRQQERSKAHGPLDGRDKKLGYFQKPILEEGLSMVSAQGLSTSNAETRFAEVFVLLYS